MWSRQRDDSAITDEELSAFADGRLPRSRAARVAAHLRAHPADADRIHAYWRQEAALYRAFEPVLAESAPFAGSGGSEGRVRSSPPSWTAAAVLVLAVAAVLGLWRWSATVPGVGSPDLAETALRAYAQKVTKDGALDGVAPEFPALDLQPVGLRRIELGDGDVVEYRYRDGDGNRLALYAVEATAPGGNGLFRVFEESGVRLVEWTADGKRYALVGEGGAAELTRLAVQLRGSMTAPAAAVAGAAPPVSTAPADETVIDAAGPGETDIRTPPQRSQGEDRIIQTGEM